MLISFKYATGGLNEGVHWTGSLRPREVEVQGAAVVSGRSVACSPAGKKTGEMLPSKCSPACPQNPWTQSRGRATPLSSWIMKIQVTILKFLSL